MKYMPFNVCLINHIKKQMLVMLVNVKTVPRNVATLLYFISRAHIDSINDIVKNKIAAGYSTEQNIQAI